MAFLRCLPALCWKFVDRAKEGIMPPSPNVSIARWIASQVVSVSAAATQAKRHLLKHRLGWAMAGEVKDHSAARYTDSRRDLEQP